MLWLETAQLKATFHCYDNNEESDDINACLRISILTTLMNSLFKALDILHAERIGHGYHVIQDEELYKRVVNEKIHLEVNGKGKISGMFTNSSVH